MVIWKYEINIITEQKIQMPEDAKVLTVQLKDNKIFIYALVNVDNPDRNMVWRVFYMYGTGENGIPSNAKYIGTVQQRDMTGYIFVWHIFEKL